MGKNQQKRIEKSIAHARMVWVREQMRVAKAVALVDEAYVMVQERRDELTDEQFELIEAEVSRRKAELEEYLFKARNNFVNKVGAENADLGLDFGTL